MPAEIYFRGAEDFSQLSAALRKAGLEGKGLRRELLKEINRETKPLKQDAKNNAKAILPKRGGLAARVARSRFSTKTRMTGWGAGVKITATGNAGARGVREIDRGMVRHPVFGNKGRWVTQRVAPGWFTKAMEKGADRVRNGVERAINSVVRSLR